MTDRLFFDTNLLVYAMDPKEPEKRTRSAGLIKHAFGGRRMTVSPQILNECYAVLVHRRKLVPSAEAAAYLRTLWPACTAPLDVQTHGVALALEARHRLSWWDSLAVASALQAGCRFFLSEDLADGRTIDALRVVNPFASHAGDTLAFN
jgi:predicted nucleic acid-binding protein